MKTVNKNLLSSTLIPKHTFSIWKIISQYFYYNNLITNMGIKEEPRKNTHDAVQMRGAFENDFLYYPL